MSRMRTNIPRPLQLLALTLLLSSAGANAAKVLPIMELTVFPENADERGLWELATRHEERIEKEDRRFTNPALEAYLESVVAKMIGDRLDHVDVVIDVIVVARPTLSAWVYPYGAIAVNTGLLAGMDNEAQLAAILGHEVSHFLQRHSYRELVVDKRQTVIGKGLGALLTAAVTAKTGSYQGGLMELGDTYTGLVTNGYSRKLENVADREGLDLMAAAGYDLGQAIPAFEALRENDAYGVVNVSTLWSSHPKLDDRIKDLQAAIKKEKKRKDYQPGQVPPSDDYYLAITAALLANAQLDLEERYFDRARTSLAKLLSARDNAQAEFLMGESYRKELPDGPDFEPRTAAYLRALDADPSYVHAHRELGMAYRQQGLDGQAADAFQQYLVLAATAADAGIIRGYLDALE